MSTEIEILKQLRDLTGAGILDCKKYLNQANNDLDEAVKLMRSEEGIKADKKSSRVAAEGVVYFQSSDSKSILIEINSETDFVARSNDFIEYVKQTCDMIMSTKYQNMSELQDDVNQGINESLESLRKKYVTKLGENIQIRRFEALSEQNGFVSGYTHNNKIGAVIVTKDKDAQLSKDICMQIVASNPIAIDEKSIDQSILDSEKDIYRAELSKLDKKDDIKRNILEGKIKKFISENTLINQPFIKDGSITLKKILSTNQILSYQRYQLGEGIDKKEEDFAEEVYSQIK